jgi:DNA-binding transcriptional LysR family regulator
VRIEQLEYVQAVTRLGSLRRAAEELHLSQPALSEAMRNLERELGVDVLDRHRSGARISDAGRELLPHIAAILEAVDRLRRAADHQHRSSGAVRLGTVNAATVSVLIPAVRKFRELNPDTRVEIVAGPHSDIERAVLEGSLDYGLVNLLDGDDVPPQLEVAILVRGCAVLCLRADSPLAKREEIPLDELAREPLVVMRSGYAMHRLLYRVLDGRMPHVAYSTDGAEMGKLLVAEGLGSALLPDYSVAHDPLERNGLLTWRPLEGAHTSVSFGLLRRRTGTPTQAAAELLAIVMGPSRPRPAAGPCVRSHPSKP